MTKTKPKFKNNSGIYGIHSNTKIATPSTKKSKYKAGAALSKPIK